MRDISSSSSRGQMIGACSMSGTRGVDNLNVAVGGTVHVEMKREEKRRECEILK